MPISQSSLAADIEEGRLESAKLLGADVTINCKTEDLKTRGMWCDRICENPALSAFLCEFWQFSSCHISTIICETGMILSTAQVFTFH